MHSPMHASHSLEHTRITKPKSRSYLTTSNKPTWHHDTTTCQVAKIAVAVTLMSQHQPPNRTNPRRRNTIAVAAPTMIPLMISLTHQNQSQKKKKHQTHWQLGMSN